MIQGIKIGGRRNPALTIAQFVVDYIKYSFLIGTVIPSVGVILITVLYNNENTSFEFLKNLSFLNSAYKDGAFGVGVGDIMKIFGIGVFILTIAGNLIKKMFAKFFGQPYMFKTNAFFLSLLITAIYIISSIVIKKDGPLGSDFYIVFAIFYLINLASMLCYLALGKLSDKISQFFSAYSAESLLNQV